jgi:hypothetical protein
MSSSFSPNHEEDIVDLKKTMETLEEQLKVSVINVHRIEGAIAITREMIAEEEKEKIGGGAEGPRRVIEATS